MKCPKCGKYVLGDLIICDACGYDPAKQENVKSNSKPENVINKTSEADISVKANILETQDVNAAGLLPGEKQIQTSFSKGLSLTSHRIRYQSSGSEV